MESVELRKTLIQIDEEVWTALNNMKNMRETFNDVLRRMVIK